MAGWRGQEARCTDVGGGEGQRGGSRTGEHRPVHTQPCVRVNVCTRVRAHASGELHLGLA